MFAAIIRHGTIMTVGVLILVVIGVLATLRIPVQMIPDLDVRTISVQTRWSGATPQDIEKEILIEQEEYLRNIPNLQRMLSSATSGEASIELEFPFGVDVTETLILVNNALSQVPSYPENVDEPQVFSASFSSNAFMYFRLGPQPGNPKNLDITMLRDFVEDNVRNRMSSVPGVSQVTVGGGAERQIQILLDADALAARNLTVTAVRDAIRERNQDASGGEIESGKRRYLLRTVGRYDDYQALGQTILSYDNGQIVRLEDVADIQLDHYQVREESWHLGEQVIGLQVQRENGANVIDIKYAMMEEVEAINREVLEAEGLQLLLNSDDVRYVEASIANVWTNLAIGAVFATLVMFLFLRNVKTTAVGVIGVPICTIAAFLGLLLFGRTINVISLAGVAFAIGMTLDNTIVVLESIELERRKGLNKLQSAIAGVQKVWPAVLASTLTTVMVFLPILFINEEAGQLYSDVAIAIASAIIVSMLVAITLVPTISARLNFATKTEPESATLQDRVVKRLSRFFATTKNQIATVVGTLIISASIVIFLTPPAEYLPEGEEAKTFAIMNAPPGYNLETMSEIGAELRDYFYPALDYEPEQFDDGEVDIPAMSTMSLSVSPENIRIIAEAKDPAQIDALMDALTTKYETYEGMRAFASRGSIISSNDGGTRSINLDISGPELGPVYDVALAAFRRAEEVFDNPRIQSDPSSLTLAQPLVEIHPIWERASELGLTAGDLGYTVAALTDGAFVNEFFQADDKIDIFLYSDAGQNARLDTLPQLPVYGAGSTLPLSSLASIRETVDTSIVRRVDGRRTVTLNIIPPRSVALESGVDIVRNEVIAELQRNGQIPQNVTTEISGAADQLDATKASLTSNYAVALVVVYLLMVAIFSHWGLPLLIMTTIPLGIAGGIVGLAAMNGVGSLLPLIGARELTQPFDMITMLGFLILMGTVVNNPILIVHRAVDNLKNGAESIVAAVREAVDSRLRPIAISTITTLCGLAPLVFIPGEGTELYRGVGAIVLFGLIGATLVTLVTLPSLTILALTLGEKWRQRKAA